MKHLKPHNFDDYLALNNLEKSEQTYISKILCKGAKYSLVDQYKLYATYVKDPKSLTSRFKKLQILSTLLINAYESAPVAVNPLKSYVQDKLSPNICPMCGSSKTGTADHYFPKEEYPEYSIFSWNLVPACDCNTKRGATLFGKDKDEWIIHPYFEKRLKGRILTIDFIFPTSKQFPEATTLEPSLKIGKLYTSGIPKATIDFHVKEIQEKTTMLDWVETEWAQMRLTPCDSLTWYPSGTVQTSEVKARVEEVRNSNDRRLGTPNNWTSALLDGIASSQNALKMVTDAINNGISHPT